MTRLLILSATLSFFLTSTGIADEPFAVGDRRELFVDDHLIDLMKNVTLKLHKPARKEVAITFDQPWEGNGGGYTTVF